MCHGYLHRVSAGAVVPAHLRNPVPPWEFHPPVWVVPRWYLLQMAGSHTCWLRTQLLELFRSHPHIRTCPSLRQWPAWSRFWRIHQLPHSHKCRSHLRCAWCGILCVVSYIKYLNCYPLVDLLEDCHWISPRRFSSSRSGISSQSERSSPWCVLLVVLVVLWSHHTHAYYEATDKEHALHL